MRNGFESPSTQRAQRAQRRYKPTPRVYIDEADQPKG
jgi:hypothetical protein